MSETPRPYWGPTKTLRTPDDIRRAIVIEARLFDPKNVPTIAQAIKSVEIGFQRDVMPRFNKCDHFKEPSSR